MPQTPMAVRKREARDRVAGGTKSKGEKHQAYEKAERAGTHHHCEETILARPSRGTSQPTPHHYLDPGWQTTQHQACSHLCL